MSSLGGGSGGCESRLVPGWIGLPLVLWSVVWHWGKLLLQGPHLHPQTANLCGDGCDVHQGPGVAAT